MTQEFFFLRTRVSGQKEDIQSALLTRISQSWLPFSEYMRIVLYEPEIGYYQNDQQKFGHSPQDGSDFITAAEQGKIFAQTLAQTIAKIARDENLNCILEIGAGSGKLAKNLLSNFAQLGLDLQNYFIFETSPALIKRQQALLAEHDKIQWLQAFPENFCGIILANEVLDALPVQLYARKNWLWYERGVTWDSKESCMTWDDRVSATVPAMLANIDAKTYITETHKAAENFIATWSQRLAHGLLLLFDYGFPEREYYHPQRNQGSLMVHYQHKASTNPLLYPGKADLSAHVNFSAIAHTAINNGLQLLGYTSFARFLLNAGLLDHLALRSSPHHNNYAELQFAQQLLSEAEMGELFKVMALGRGIQNALSEFQIQDRSHTL